MAAPNIINATNITGKTVVANLTTTSATSVLSNAAASNKVFKINTIMVANVDGTTAANITINYYSAAALGGTATEIVSTVGVPADASLVIISKDTPLYLEEDRSIGAIASTGGDLKVICSYEDIT